MKQLKNSMIFIFAFFEFGSFIQLVNGEDILILLKTKNTQEASLYESPSLNSKITEWSELPLAKNNSLEDYSEYLVEGSCENAQSRVEIITNAIQRAVNFYELQSKDLHVIDSAVGLMVLEGVLEHISEKIGEIPVYSDISERIKPLIDRILNQAENVNASDAIKSQIRGMTKESRKGLWSKFSFEWKSPSSLKSLEIVQDVGNEKDGIWSELNRECLAALVNKCEVPYICKSTYLNKEPQSQYMLTHQALYLLFARRQGCDMKHPELFLDSEELLKKQCSKMFQEAILMAKHGFPSWSRDLFNEYVFICGQAGYSNFLRIDWVDAVLAFQSPSYVGCFISIRGQLKYESSDTKIMRVLTEEERANNVTAREECLSHLTSTSLATLAVQLAWFLDKCIPPTVVA